MNPEKKNPKGGARLEKKAKEPTPQLIRDTKPSRSNLTSNPKANPKTKPKRTRAQKIRRVVFIVLTVIAALIVGLYIAFSLLTAPPSVDNFTPKPVVTTIIDEEGNEIEIEIPGLSVDRKEQFYTFLVVGQDTGGGGNTDVLLLAAYDVPNQALNVMSIPRDTYVPYHGRSVLINSVYNRAGAGDDGIQALKEAVGELTGVTPDFHVIIQWEAVGELVDAIDGVYFDVPRNMNYDDPTQDLHIHVNKGYQLLNGEDAMGVVRYRHDTNPNYGYPDADLGRIKTQQAFLTAVLEKCLQPDVLLPNLMEYINIFQKNVETDLTIPEMAYFGKSAIGGLDMNSVEFITLPNKASADGAHLLPVADEILEVVNEDFNPYQEDISLRDLNVVTQDPGRGSGSGSSSRPTQTTRPSAAVEPSEDPEETAQVSDSPSVSDPGGSTPGGSSAPVESQTPAATHTPVISPVQTPAHSAAQSEAPVQTAQPTPPPATPVPTPAPAAPTPDANGVVMPPEAEGAAA